MTTTATIARPLSFAGVPVGSWVLGIRSWVVVVVALTASFWLELKAQATAASTVALLAEPTRGRAVTATITIKDVGGADSRARLDGAIAAVEAPLFDVLDGPPARPECVQATPSEKGVQ